MKLSPWEAKGVDRKQEWMHFQLIHPSSSAHLNPVGAYCTEEQVLTKSGGMIQRGRGVLECHRDAFTSSAVRMLLMLHLFAVLFMRPTESIFPKENTKIQFKVWSLPLLGLSHLA